MSLNIIKINEETTKKKSDLGRLEDGSYNARIVSVIDCGLQAQTDWKTKKAIDPKKVVMITYETPDELITYTDKDENEVTKPRWQTKEYGLNMYETTALAKLCAALKPDIESLDELLNVPCMVTIGTTDGGNAKITAVNKPMKGATVGELANDSFYFDFSEPNMELFNGLLAWQQKKVKSALDYNGFADNNAASIVAASGTDDIPF